MPFDQLDLKRAIAGDERAMQRLWSQHAPHIDAVVRRLCDDSELAADISQEVWMQIFRALPSYRGDSQFGTWAHRIAVNRTLNACLLYTSDAADDLLCVDLGGRRIIKKKK